MTKKSRKRCLVTRAERLERAQNEHQRFLYSVGFTGEYGSQRINQIPSYKVETRTLSPTSNIIGNGNKKQNNTYTGDELMGISTMHKSNSVPIRKDSSNAKEHANMRR